MNFDEIWNDDWALSSCSRDDAEYFYNEGAKSQQGEVDRLQTKIDELNEKNSEEKRILHNVIEMNQSKIDELQARVDEALTYLRHTDFRECKESILFNILKGNKDEN